MLRLLDAAKFRGSRAALVFRTVIVDKAGGAPWCRPVVAEIVEADIAGVAILLTRNRTHLQFPLRALHKPTAGIDEAVKACQSVAQALKAFASENISYVGGQELIWDVHNAIEPATLRYLTVDEIAEILSDRDALIDADV
jgi:hypothetical protein